MIFLDVALINSDAIDVLNGLGKRKYRGLVHLMSGGRAALLEAVQRLGVRNGVAFGPAYWARRTMSLSRVLPCRRSPSSRMASASTSSCPI